MPLQIELLYQDNNSVADFAVTTLLTLVALVILVAMAVIERVAAARAKTTGIVRH